MTGCGSSFIRSPSRWRCDSVSPTNQGREYQLLRSDLCLLAFRTDSGGLQRPPGDIMPLLFLYLLFVWFWWSGLRESELV